TSVGRRRLVEWRDSCPKDLATHPEEIARWRRFSKGRAYRRNRPRSRGSKIEAGAAKRGDAAEARDVAHVASGPRKSNREPIRVSNRDRLPARSGRRLRRLARCPGLGRVPPVWTPRIATSVFESSGRKQGRCEVRAGTARALFSDDDPQYLQPRNH